MLLPRSSKTPRIELLIRRSPISSTPAESSLTSPPAQDSPAVATDTFLREKNLSSTRRRWRRRRVNHQSDPTQERALLDSLEMSLKTCSNLTPLWTKTSESHHCTHR